MQVQMEGHMHALSCFLLVVPNVICHKLAAPAWLHKRLLSYECWAT
jgi:hypothetical protein